MAKRWPERVCCVCSETFCKAPTFATCGHPVCVKVYRADAKKARDSMRSYRNPDRLPNWTPPDVYAPDRGSRDAVWRLLRNAEVLTPEIVQLVAIRVKIKPAEVFGIWKSIKKES